MSSLPKIERKWLQTNLISSKKKIKYRPFTVGEQKKIIISKSTGQKDEELYKSVLDLVQNCVEGVDVTSLYPVEFEKLFYEIRGASDGNILLFTLDCDKCKQTTNQEVNTKEDFKIKNENNFILKVPVSGTDIIVEFSQPTIKDGFVLENQEFSSDVEKGLSILPYCLKTVIKGEEVHKDFSIEDASEFVDELPNSAIIKFSDFFNNSPKLEVNKKFTCDFCKKEIDTSKMEVRDFFS